MTVFSKLEMMLPGLIVVVFLSLASLYSLSVPVFEAPDESAHYLYADYLARNGRLPLLDYQAPQDEYHHPPLYYWFNSLWVRVSGLPDPEPFLQKNPFAAISDTASLMNKHAFRHNLAAERWPWQGTVLSLRLARFASILMGALTVWFAYQIGRYVFDDSWLLAGATAALVAFNPQFIFINASMNNDNLVVLLVTACLWLALHFSRAVSLPWYHGLWAGLLVGLAILSKPTGWIGGVGIGAAFLWQITNPNHKRTKGGRNMKQALGALLVMLGVVSLLAGWWLLRNQSLYQDLFLRRYLMAYLNIDTPHPLTLSLFMRRLQEAEISFWATFGWLNLVVPDIFYAVYRWMVRLAVLGLGLGAILAAKGRRKTWPDVAKRMIIPVLMLIAMAVTMWQWVGLAGGIQGRLLFPVIVPLALVVVWGWRNLVGEKGLWLWPIYSLGVAVYALVAVLKPAYAYPPVLSQLPTDATLARVRFGESISLVGYMPPARSLRPDDPFEVTLFWRAEQPVNRPLAVLFQAVDDHALVLAQIEGYPGGMLSADQWPAQQIVQHRLLMRFPGLTFTPAQGMFRVGLTNPDSGEIVALTNGELMAGLAEFTLKTSEDGPFDVNKRVAFEEQIALLGYDLLAQSLKAGETFEVTLYWSAEGSLPENYTVFVHIFDTDGVRVAQHDSWPADGLAPTSAWLPGQPVADRHRVQLPATLSPGAYRVGIGLYQAETGRRIPLRPEEGLFGQDLLELTQIWVQ